MEDIEIYEEINLNDMELHNGGTADAFWRYDCPCGDVFTATQSDLAAGVRIFECPTCSLKVRVTVNESFMKDLASPPQIPL